jgi:hypothetical protein
MLQAKWMSVLFLHYEVEPARLQAEVPFLLDVREGKAYVSVVAFSQERLRFAFGGRMTNWVGRWFANHEFLNVRTYVRREGETGIFFLAEWVPKRVATWLGPPLFGLPYRFGKIEYEHGERMMRGRVMGHGTEFSYRAERDDATCFAPCEGGSLDEFLLERYVAYTEWHGLRRTFRVRHEPWPQARLEVTVDDESLLRERFAWWPETKRVSANFSPGPSAVTIGRPQFVKIPKDDYENIGNREQWANRVETGFSSEGRTARSDPLQARASTVTDWGRPRCRGAFGGGTDCGAVDGEEERAHS